MKPYVKILASIDREFQKALDEFHADDFFQAKTDNLYTDEEKKRIYYRWLNLVRPFRQLKSIIRSLSWQTLFFRRKNAFVIRYASVITYYNMLYSLRASFGKHEEFIRQYLDDNFRENYSTLARYVYTAKFYSVLLYPREYFLELQDEVDPILAPLFARKDRVASDMDKRWYHDRVDIWYYIRYRLSLLFSWISKHWGRLIAHIHFSQRKRWLILRENMNILLPLMTPWDIILTRQNWVATNMGIPGFWKHMSMYIGLWKDIKKSYYEFRSVHTLADDVHYIIEAIGSGVRIIPIDELILHNDYIGVIRSKFSPEKLRRSIHKTLSLVGKEYDYSFNFYSDTNYVCSTLVTKAYLPEYSQDEWIHIHLTRIGTGITYPPTDIVKKFAWERESDDAELDFVGFIDSHEKWEKNFFASADEFCKTALRPRLSIFLP